jgi:hypothetical protein
MRLAVNRLIVLRRGSRYSTQARFPRGFGTEENLIQNSTIALWRGAI